MNYEDFSPEAKAGIEQYKRCLEYEIFHVKNKNLWIHWVDQSKMIASSCILNGADFIEAAKAQEFAKSKNYWLDQNV